VKNHKTGKVIKMVRSGPKGEANDLLKIWNPKNLEEELPYSVIVERAKEILDVKERTVINYLNCLVEDRDLEKRVDDKRNTFYKPINKMKVTKSVLHQLIEQTKDDFAIEALFGLGFLIKVEITRARMEHKPKDPDQIVDLAIQRMIERRGNIKKIKSLHV